MADLSPSSARVVDPILSHHVQGYRHPERAGHLLFPAVPVGVSGGQVLEFGKESFKLYAARRAPGAATKRISFGYEGKPFALYQDSLEAPVPREWQRDANKVPGIDLGKRAVNMTMNTISLSLEYEQANIAINAANYDANHKIALAGATKWSAATGTPLTDIAAGKEATRQTIGLEPNTLILSPGAWLSARDNPSVVERFKFTTDEPISLDMFKKLVEIETVAVGKAISASDAGVFSDLWGNNAILAYVPKNPSGMEEPSYGYTYTMEGHPLVEEPYFEKQSKSWIYGVTNERAPVLTGMLAGYLIQNPK